MFTIFLANFSCHGKRSFDTFEAALIDAKRKCFETVILHDGVRVAVWSPIGGLRRV